MMIAINIILAYLLDFMVDLAMVQKGSSFKV